MLDEIASLRDLLAVIRRDGGHHTAEVGVKQSVEDAHQIWAAQQTEIADLRVQLAQRIDPKAMLRWDDDNGLWFGSFLLGWVLKQGRRWRISGAGEVFATAPIFSNKSEARAAVERAVLEALGVKEEDRHGQ